MVSALGRGLRGPHDIVERPATRDIRPSGGGAVSPRRFEVGEQRLGPGAADHATHAGSDALLAGVGVHDRRFERCPVTAVARLSGDNRYSRGEGPMLGKVGSGPGGAFEGRQGVAQRQDPGSEEDAHPSECPQPSRDGAPAHPPQQPSHRSPPEPVSSGVRAFVRHDCRHWLAPLPTVDEFTSTEGWWTARRAVGKSGRRAGTPRLRATAELPCRAV